LHFHLDEGIVTGMSVRVPGTDMNIQPAKVDFRYGDSLGTRAPKVDGLIEKDGRQWRRP
jgi:hypothetical protein